MRVGLVEEDRLEDVVLVRLRRFVARCARFAPVAGILAELVLVIGAIEGHLDLLRVLLVAVRVVHGPIAGGFAVGLAVLDLVLGEGDLVFLLLVLGLGTEGVGEGGLVVGGEVGGIGVGDGDVVEEFGAPQDEAFAPGGGFAQEFFRGVGEDTEDQFVIMFFCDALGGVGGATSIFLGGNFARRMVKGGGVYDDAVLGGARLDGRDRGGGADFDAFGAKVVGPVAIEVTEVGEGNHLREIREECLWVVIPKLHVWVVEEAFKDGAGDVGGLVALFIISAYKGQVE